MGGPGPCLCKALRIWDCKTQRLRRFLFWYPQPGSSGVSSCSSIFGPSIQRPRGPMVQSPCRLPSLGASSGSAPQPLLSLASKPPASGVRRSLLLADVQNPHIAEEMGEDVGRGGEMWGQGLRGGVQWGGKGTELPWESGWGTSIGRGQGLVLSKWEGDE